MEVKRNVERVGTIELDREREIRRKMGRDGERYGER